MRGSNKMDIHVYVLIVCNYFNWISGRTWQTVYMDDSTHCSLNRIKNDNMAESDYYRVMSDSWNGKSRWAQRPAECWLAFNFGDRYVTVTLDEWRCRAEFQKPFLSIYDDCHGKRKNLLAQLNCSVQVPMTVRSSGPCISLYHYRGHTKWGYFFSLHVAARQEIIAFPAGGIAGLIIGIIVFIMIIVKIVCVVSGFEDRLPMLNLQPNEQKQIMANALSSVTKISESNSTGDTRIKETIVMNVPNEQTILRVTRSSMCSENNDADGRRWWRRRRRNSCTKVNCEWGSFGSYGSCSQGCGTGIQYSYRSVVRSASCGGSSCTGGNSRSRLCNTHSCCSASNCVWGNFGSWSSCTANCGSSGIKSRHRSLVRSASCGGSCSGSSSETSSCNRGCPNGGTPNGGSSCSCPATYRGRCCETRNYCVPQPCVYGTCSDLGDTFKCTCSTGYEGVTCRQDINECSKNPCKNNGLCVNSPGSYECKCKTGYLGEHCESDINECLNPNQCENGGSCTNLNGGFSCKCASGFKGTNCEQDIDECLGKPCKNKGKCINEFGGYKCSCPSQYQGLDCMFDVNECLTKPCKNEAKCVNQEGSYECKCAFGFQGIHCEKDIDECSLNVCQNGGYCTNSFGDYKCDCSVGFSGKSCEHDNNECLQDPCLNGATCMNNHGSYSCNCESGFEGKHCSQDINECLVDKPCINRSKCSNTFGSYTCKCRKGFIGKNCHKGCHLKEVEGDNTKFKLGGHIMPCPGGLVFRLSICGCGWPYA